MRVLIIAESGSSLLTVKPLLASKGFLVGHGSCSKDVFDRWSDHDLVLLDFELEDMNALSMLRALRLQHINTPVIIVSENGNPNLMIECLEAGADDYMKAPFNPQELVARVAAVMRRIGRPEPARLRIGSIELVPHERAAYANGKRMTLVGRQYCLLELFALNPGGLVQKESIYERLYGNDSVPVGNPIATHLSRLRRVLEKNDVFDQIEAVPCHGYRFIAARH